MLYYIYIRAQCRCKANWGCVLCRFSWDVYVVTLKCVCEVRSNIKYTNHGSAYTKHTSNKKQMNYRKLSGAPRANHVGRLNLTQNWANIKQTSWCRITSQKSSLLWCFVIKGSMEGMLILIKHSWPIIHRLWLLSVRLCSTKCRLDLHSLHFTFFNYIIN